MAVLYDEGKDILRASDGSVLLDTGPAPGSIEDFAGRFRRLLPTGWFPPAPQGLEAESAPVLAAILRGFGAVLAGIWQLMQECSLQMRLATMSGAFLDMAAEDYFGDGGLVRQASEPDVVYRKRIRAALFAERNTRQAVTNALVAVTGVQPVIIETLNASDCHALACESVPAMGGGTVMVRRPCVTAAFKVVSFLWKHSWEKPQIWRQSAVLSIRQQPWALPAGSR